MFNNIQQDAQLHHVHVVLKSYCRSVFYGGTLHLDEFVLGENPLTNFYSSEKVLPGPNCCKEKGYVEGKHGIDGAN